MLLRSHFSQKRLFVCFYRGKRKGGHTTQATRAPRFSDDLCRRRLSPCEPHGSSPGPRTFSLGTETGKGRGLRAGAPGFPGPLGKASLSLTCGPSRSVPSRSTGACCNGREGAPLAGRKLRRDPAAGAAPRGAAAAGPGGCPAAPSYLPG